MSEHIDPTPTSSPLGVVDEILAVIAAEDPHGATAAQVARATLEELVEQGVLDRLGIGHGAVYTLNVRA